MDSLFPAVPAKVRFGTYPYTFARVSAMKGKLIRSQDYQKLLKMQLAEIAKFLEEQEYKREIDTLAVQHSGVQLLTVALDQHFANVVEKLRRISDPEFALLIDAYLSRRSIANIKTILRGKLQGHSPERIQGALQRGGVLSKRAIEQLLNAQSPDAVLEQIARLGIPELAEAREQFAHAHDLSAVEHALDTAYYTKLLILAGKFPEQGTLFRNFLLTELDNRNLFTMLRLREAKVPAEEIRKRLLPAGKRFSPKTLLRLAELSDEELAKALAAYKVAPPQPQRIVDLEVQRQKALLDSAVLLLHQNPLSVDVLLGYLFAKEVEIRNLRMIIMGKHLGMGEEFLASNLVIGG